MQPIESHVENWLQNLEVQNFSVATRALYQDQLHAFTQFLERRAIQDVRRVNKTLLQDYYLSLLQHTDPRPYSVSTLAVKVRAVKSLFKFLTESRVLIVDVSEVLKEPKVTRLPRGILTVAEVVRLLDCPDLSTVEGVRDRAILETLYSSGIRLGELVRLTLLDLNLSDGLLTVREGKGGKDRMVPVGAVAVKFLTAYLVQARPELLTRSHGKKNEARLWLNRWGSPLSGMLIQRMVLGYGAVIGKPLTPHTLRHSCATHLLNNGANLRLVQELLGHVRTSTTQLYTRVTLAEVKQTHAAKHPRSVEQPAEAFTAPTLLRHPA
jgi:site-specific recombinase XerD